jgi:hypothetical protein
MRSGLSGQRLIAVFLGGALLINYPLLSLFDRPQPDVAGVPLLYIYVFVVWMILILAMAWIIERGTR